MYLTQTHVFLKDTTCQDFLNKKLLVKGFTLKSHISPLTSHLSVSRLTSQISYLTSHLSVSSLTSQISYLTSHLSVSRLTSHVSHLISQISPLTTHISTTETIPQSIF